MAPCCSMLTYYSILLLSSPLPFSSLASLACALLRVQDIGSYRRSATAPVLVWCPSRRASCPKKVQVLSPVVQVLSPVEGGRKRDGKESPRGLRKGQKGLEDKEEEANGNYIRPIRGAS